MFSDWIRKAGFYTLDFLKGSSVRRHYRDISDKMNNKKECYNELPELLRYAKENVPFYNGIKGSELSDFPVISKRVIKENYDHFQSKEFLGARLYKSYTSGSSGEPLIISQNADKRYRVKADLIYHHKINHWEIGYKYVFLRPWSVIATSKLRTFLQNCVKIDVQNFNNEAKESFRQLLKRDSTIKVILGYASALTSFVDYLDEKSDNAGMFNIKVIYSDSDSLSDKTKTRLEKIFGCPIINRYSNVENGVLACTLPYDNTFILNRASFYFELLKLESDEPVGPGELGRLVITDLYNHSMPFIRYDTGDLATSDDKDRRNLMTLSCLHGRISDLIKDTYGNCVSDVIIAVYLDELDKIKRYQFSQIKLSTYLLKVVCDVNVYNKEFLQSLCKKFLGDDATIIIEYVDEIPIEKTGKYKKVINYLERKN